MSFHKIDDVSFSVTSIFMKLVGFWMATDRSEQRLRDITLIYTLIALLFAFWIQITDLFYSWGDFGACLYIVCNVLSTAMPFFKVLILFAHKEDFFRLVLYLKRKFLHADYDDYEKNIVTNCKQKCTFFICSFILLTQATIVSYIVNPIIANIGKNESDRVLPFNMWVDLPLSITPYYEITFILQVLSLYHIGISYFCFDNFLCIMNLHVACQFRVLQYRMTSMMDLKDKEKLKRNEILIVNSSCFANECYTTLKKYIRQHQILIAYCTKVEEVFNMVILEQVLMFSLLICLDGYQILIADAPTRTRFIFSFHILACLCQLLMFTYSCDCIIRESMNVATAVYRGLWPVLPMTTSGRMMRKDLTLVIMRSGVPCCLTGKGFFTVSLETYTSVLSTAASYFALLKQRTVEATS